MYIYIYIYNIYIYIIYTYIYITYAYMKFEKDVSHFNNKFIIIDQH